MKTFGRSTYFISVYYTDEYGCTHSDTSRWTSIENAKDHYDYYSKMIGEYSVVYDGKISAVTSFVANQCLFE